MEVQSLRSAERSRRIEAQLEEQRQQSELAKVRRKQQLAATFHALQTKDMSMLALDFFLAWSREAQESRLAWMQKKEQLDLRAELERAYEEIKDLDEKYQNELKTKEELARKLSEVHKERRRNFERAEPHMRGEARPAAVTVPPILTSFHSRHKGASSRES